MALTVKVIQANTAEQLETAIADYLTNSGVGAADMINVTVNDLKGRPTATIVHK